MAQAPRPGQTPFPMKFRDVVLLTSRHRKIAANDKDAAASAVTACMESGAETAARIGRFEIVRPLGQGSQGRVWLARDPDLRRLVAIKTIDVNGPGQAEATRTLLEEAVLIGQIAHPNVVTLFDAGRDAGKPFLVFEFVPGSTLATLISRAGALPAARACELAIEILKGIEAAHQKGVVHRDLKPSNVMVTEAGIPRIMDFGVATVASSAAPGDGVFLGTPGYAAPECVTTGDFSTASDIFSVGMVLHEMLTGRPAVSGRTPWEILHRTATAAVERPSLHGRVDAALDAIVLKAVASDPGKRFESARLMRETLERYVSAAGTPALATDGTSGAIEFLLRRIQARNDLPSLSGTISAVCRAANSSREGVTGLAATILKDFALTTRLLRVANTARYAGQGRGISTISRGIMVMGFDQVRAAALGLALFGHLQKGSETADLREELTASYLAGVLARYLAGHPGLRDTEEAFICALFHGLGRILAAFCFREEFAELKKLMVSGIPEREAAERALGSRLDTLGIRVAETWNLPDHVRASMVTLEEAPGAGPAAEPERLRLLAALANDVVHAIRHTPEDSRADRLLDVEARFGNALGVHQSHIIAATARAIGEIARDAPALELDTTASVVFRQTVSWSRQFTESEVVEEISSTLALAAAQARPASADRAVQADTTRRVAILRGGVDDITAALVGRFVLNDLLRLVIDTMLRGAGFTRVLLLTRDAAANTLRARIGVGLDAGRFIQSGFSVPLAPAADVFSLALRQGNDVCIDDIDEPGVRGRIPQWYRSAEPGRTFCLLPILLNDRPAALIHGDSDRPGSLAFTAEELSLLKTLRNQAVLAIRTKHA